MVWCFNTENFIQFDCDFLRHLNDISSSSSWTIHIPYPVEATTVTLNGAYLSQMVYNILLVKQQFVVITPTVHQTGILDPLFNWVTNT
jgi:hypothetical protein